MMDLQEFVNKFHTMTSILSVEKRDDDKIGTIRIEAANNLYIHAMEKVDKDGNVVFKEKFIPGSSYERYMKKELNFENFCYECAIKKKPVHAYIRPEYYNFCINLYMMPLNINDPKKAYCSYSQEISFEENIEAMSNISATTSSNVLQTCIKLRGAADLQKTMDEVIEDIRQICDASYCCVLLTDFNEHTWSVFSDALKKDSSIHSIRDLKDQDFVEFAKSWIDTLAGSNCLMIKNQYDLEVIHKANPTWYESLTGANVKSLVLLPLEYNGTTIGFIWVANFNTSNTLIIRETLELTAFFVASEIANYQLLGKLETLSRIDLLTGAMNRNSMNNKVTQFMNGEVQFKSLGVIFADLNGLKSTNDNQGHDAGDKLLKDAAQILRSSFSDCELYRAGGDEFLVIALDKPKKDLEDKVNRIREESMIPGKVSFAIGLYYCENGESICTAMHKADGLMYEDKKRYYDRFPANRRRFL